MATVKVNRERDYDHPADAVFAVLADFGDLSWVPGVEVASVEGEGAGMVRYIRMKKGDPLPERLDSVDPVARTFSYSIEDGRGLPMDQYSASVEVVALDADRARILWEGVATPIPGMDEKLGGLLGYTYDLFLDALEKKLSSG